MVRRMPEEVGQPCDTIMMEFSAAMKTPGYRAVNPTRQVPALRHGETVVTECGAIIACPAMTFPEAGLLPDDRGDLLRRMFYGAGPLEQAVTMTSLGFEVSKERRCKVGFGHFDRVPDTLEGLVGAGEYLAGGCLSAIDAYLAPQIAWGVRLGTLPARPGFADHAARILSRPAAQRASAIDDAAMPKNP